MRKVSNSFILKTILIYELVLQTMILKSGYLEFMAAKVDNIYYKRNNIMKWIFSEIKIDTGLFAL